MRSSSLSASAPSLLALALDDQSPAVNGALRLSELLGRSG
jgi:hypothetical protein